MAKAIVPLFSPIKDVFPLETLMQDYEADLRVVGEAILESVTWECLISEHWLKQLPKLRTREQRLISLSGLASMAYIAGMRNQQVLDKQGRC
jgi:hypothetical protein